MEQLLPILIGTSVGFGFFYENLKLQKLIKQVEFERNQLKNQIDRYFRQMKRAVSEAKNIWSTGINLNSGKQIVKNL